MQRVVLINRGFWPDSDVPGASLLALSEDLAKNYETIVLTQSNIDIQSRCRNEGRGASVEIRACRLYTNSNSKILFRAVETLFFSLWTFVNLCRIRPAYLYVATDPPVILPFMVCLFSKLSGAKYTYHLQDIHPEASRIVIKVSNLLYWLMVFLDNITLKNAKSIVTITPEMREYIKNVRCVNVPIFLLDNATAYPVQYRKKTKKTVVFCGNAGRLQEIPIVVSSIDRYLSSGGQLKFTFIGSGVYAHLFKELAEKWHNVDYIGYLKIEDAIEVVSQHEWGLLPVMNSVLKFAFPSKSSAYLAAGCKILAICDNDSSLGRWTNNNNRGLVSIASVDSIVNALFTIESGRYTANEDFHVENLVQYRFEFFSEKLKKIITE